MQAPTQRYSLDMLNRAQDAIAYLMENGNFAAVTKSQFALVLGWVKPGTNGHDLPHTRWVDEACNATRDMPEFFAGFVIAYSSIQGGMVLVDPDGELSIHGMLKLISGDMHKQHMCQTVNRRRLPTWNSLGRQLSGQGDVDGSRLAFQAENEIDQNGFVSQSTWGNFVKHARARGLEVGAA